MHLFAFTKRSQYAPLALYHLAPLYQPTEIKDLINAQIDPRNWTYAYTNQAD